MAVEIQSICCSGPGFRIFAFPIHKGWIIDGLAAIEAHDPLAFPREADVQGVEGLV
jgi:hypothetical protein